MHTLSTSKRKLERRGSKPDQPVMILERTLGISSCNRSSSLSLHPNASKCPIIAIPTGCVVTLYNHRRNRQTGFLLPAPVKSLKTGNAVNGAGTRPVSCVEFSPDGQVLASGHQPRIMIWDHAHTLVVSELHGHKFGVLAMRFSPNGRNLVSVGYQHDGCIFVWNWKTGQKLATARVTTPISSLSFSQDASFFVTGGTRHIKFWFMDSIKASPAVSSNPAGKTPPVPNIEGKFGVLGEHKNSSFSDVACGIGTLSQHTYGITEAGLLVLFGEGHVMEKWVDLKVRKGFSVDVSDKYVVCGCTDGIIRIFEPFTLKYIMTLPKPHPVGVDVATSVGSSYRSPNIQNAVYASVVAVKVDHANEKVVAMYSDRSMFIWDVKDPKHVGKYRSFLNHSDCIWGVEMVPSQFTLPPEPSPLPSALESPGDSRPPPTPTGRHLPPGTFVTCSADGTIRFWNLEIAAHDGHTSSSGFLGRNLYSRELIKVLYLDKTALSKLSAIDDGSNDNTNERGGIKSIRISPDGDLLASGDRSGNLRIHDLSTFEERTYLEAHEAEILTMDFSGEREQGSPYFLSTASRDRLIHIFDISRNLNLIQTLDDHSASITAVRFARQGRELVSCAADKSIIFRALQGGPYPEYVTYHNSSGRATVYDLDVDPSNKVVAGVTQDKKLTVFSIETGKPVRMYKPDLVNDPPSDSGGFIKVAMSPTGSFAVVAGTDRVLRVFDLATGIVVARGTGHSELITSVKFALDGTRIISTSGDGCIFIWRFGGALSHVLHQQQMSPITRDFDNESVDFDSTPETGTGMQSFAKRAEIQRPFTFSFTETALPAWARERDTESDIESKVSESGGSRPSTATARTKGRWAQRVDEDGISLYSETPEISNPVAKWADVYERRYSLETGLEADGPRSSGISPVTPPIVGESSLPRMPDETRPPIIPTVMPKQEDLVIEDVAETDGSASPALALDDLESEEDDGGLDIMDTVYVDPADNEEPVTGSTFVIAEEKIIDTPSEIAPSTETGSPPVEEEIVVDEEEEEPEKLPDGENLDFDPYFGDAATTNNHGGENRQSLSAKHISSRTTIPTSQPQPRGVGTRILDFVLKRDSINTSVNTDSPLKKRKEQTAREVDKVRQRLATLGIVWKSGSAGPDESGVILSPSDNENGEMAEKIEIVHSNLNSAIDDDDDRPISPIPKSPIRENYSRPRTPTSASGRDVIIAAVIDGTFDKATSNPSPVLEDRRHSNVGSGLEDIVDDDDDNDGIVTDAEDTGDAIEEDLPLDSQDVKSTLDNFRDSAQRATKAHAQLSQLVNPTPAEARLLSRSKEVLGQVRDLMNDALQSSVDALPSSGTRRQEDRDLLEKYSDELLKLVREKMLRS
ncbi:hypothetical protein SmJEL517_g02222 [Synchytrium microbalum]|uniref:MABP1/WDR62 second WD40 domain-containing protein n=1 Tax=Synchytrium microbalum TaxID=1806994 RepID=A0A507C7R6_9FUNG|nr:uncharacterized protein SmJEL517_g02222 [Synchytrium microbalum]TPX35368.1 hypothetical protein SmJEL517_g02222 [Synchytrium microbalum]